MAYDRDFGPRGARRRGASTGRGEFGTDYEAPVFRGGYDMGYEGGALRSRGSWIEGARRAAEARPYDDEFEWGGGYIGGRGYGGTNYDYEHGYRTSIAARRPRGGALRARPGEFSSPAARGGYTWGEEARISEDYGPARYGYGPYFDRLQRRRRPDHELRQAVEDALFYDTWVDADAIEVEVHDGVVTLSGTLPSYEEVRFAVDDAWDVDGVRGVRSRLEVAGPAARAGREGERAGREGERAGRESERAGRESERAGRESERAGREGERGEAPGRGRRRASAAEEQAGEPPRAAAAAHGAASRAATARGARAARGGAVAGDTAAGAPGRTSPETRARSAAGSSRRAGSPSGAAARTGRAQGRQDAGRAAGTAGREEGRPGARAGGGIESGASAARSAGTIGGAGGAQVATPVGTPVRVDVAATQR